MIRIRNIARDNRKLRYRDDNIYLPKGRYVRVNERREIVIDYNTYLKNIANIALPGEELTDRNTFLAVAGVEEIRRNMGSPAPAADPVAPSTGITPPAATADSLDTKDDTGITDPPDETPENVNPSPNEDAALKEAEALALKEQEEANIAAEAAALKEKEDAEKAAEEARIAQEQADAEEAEAKAKAEAAKKKTIQFTQATLAKKNHQELDELLIKYDVVVPPQSNKQVKIDALLRLNNG